jgi:Raf kinase inhibitor-like YbhB/YbcL family protein
MILFFLALVFGVTESGGIAMAFELSSAAFKPGEMIPKKHTCDANDVSPPLAWTEPPAGVKSLALVCDDPDAPAGTWVHWVLWDMPPTARSLPEGVALLAKLEDGTRQGTNDFKKTGYGGPCPPRGVPHRYSFRLYALDTVVGLAPGATKAALEKAMQGHTLGQAEVMGRYGRD